ncbi:MAG: O-antigen ligase family protein [Vicinamibacteria bacterium]
MESDKGESPYRGQSSSRVRLEWLGEALLIGALLIAPWIYGAVEDTVRYALCATVLVASALFLWPDLRHGALPRGAGGALAFPALALLQIVFRQSVAPIMTVEAALVAFAMAVVWAAIDARGGSSSTNSSRRLSFAVLLVCVSESAFAALQWSTDRRALFGQRGDFQTMPFGSYVNHNNFAGLVSLAVPLAIAMAIGDLRRSGKLTPRGLGLMGLAVGLVIAVFASGSRGGAVALVGGLLILASISAQMRKRRGRKAVWIGALVTTLVIVIGGALAVPSATRSRLVKLFDKGGSADYRVDIARASWRAFAHQPLMGSGLGAFADAATPFKEGHGDVRSERAEADLVEFVVEGGLLFVGALLFFGRWAWRSVKQEIVEGRDRSGKWLRAGAFAACATMLIHSLFDFGFRIPANALAFAVLLGIATAQSEVPRIPRRGLSLGLFALLFVVAGACAYRSLGAAGERAALTRKTPESRLEALQPLVDAHPYLSHARRQRGLAWMALAYSNGQYEPSRLQRASSDFEAVISARPQWGEAHADLGWVKYFQADTKEAKEQMSLATRFDPTHVGVGIASAQLMAWTGDLAGALSEISRLRLKNPQWSKASARDLASSWTQDPVVLGSIQ